MKRGSLIAASVATALVLAAAGALAQAAAPPGLVWPTHWDAAGQADRFGAGGLAPYIGAIAAVIGSMLFAVVPKIEPLQRQMAGSAVLLRACWIGFLALAAMIQVSVLAVAFSIDLSVSLPLLGIGLYIVAIGYFLTMSAPGFFIGFRTPWALIDPDNWHRTQRFASKTVMLAGAIIASNAALPLPSDLKGTITIAALILASVPPFIYSYLIWRSGPRRESFR